MQEDNIGLTTFHEQHSYEIEPILNPLEHQDIVNDKLYDIVLEEIFTLPEIYKGILSDFLIDKMSIRDLSNKYNLNENTIKTRIRNAKIKIKKTIKSNHSSLVSNRQELLK